MPVVDPKKSVMIAFLPTTTYWGRQDLPHMTLVYAGEIPDLKPTLKNELIKAALDISRTYPKFTLNVLKVGLLGDKSNVESLILGSSPDLIAMRKLVEQWNKSTYPFKPHAAIGPVGSSGKDIPKTLTFDKILVSWGESKTIYDLRKD